MTSVFSIELDEQDVNVIQSRTDESIEEYIHKVLMRDLYNPLKGL